MKRKQVSSRTFYGKANKYARTAAAGYKLGKSVLQQYSKGKAVVKAANRFVAKSRRSTKSKHFVGATGSHNDWERLPMKTFNVTKNKPLKGMGNFELVHSKDYIEEDTATGFQRVNDMQRCLVKYQLNGTTSNLIADYKSYWATDPFQLNPYSTAPNNAIYTATPAAVISNDKLGIKSVTSSCKMVSLAPFAQKVSIYWYVCNRDTGDNPNNTWNDLLTEQNYLQPTQGSGPSTTAATTSTGIGYLSTSIPGQTPPKRMSLYWRCLHKDQFILQPGDNLEMTRKFLYNRVVTKQYISEATNHHLRGLSLCPMIVVEGAIVGLANDGESFPPTNVDRVTQGRTKVGFVFTDTIQFCALPTNRYEIKRAEIGVIQNNYTNITAVIDAEDAITNAAVLG